MLEEYQAYDRPRYHAIEVSYPAPAEHHRWSGSAFSNRHRIWKEESIRLDYLKRLNERYEAWISTYDKGKLLVIDVDNNNFPESQEDLGEVINLIDAEINGLF